MLFHVSIEADDPRRVAEVIAELWHGVALPFPLMAGSWAAFAKDDRGTIIEVYPRGTELHEAPDERAAIGVLRAPRRNSAAHAAIATDLEIEAVYRIALREGWSVKYCRRGGQFGVIEIWIDGCQMIAVLTPEMQREYRDSVAVANWRYLLASREIEAA